MVTDGLIQSAKLALRITTDAFDEQINDLLEAAISDLGIAGVAVFSPADAIVRLACITFVRMHFGQPDEYDRLKASYDEQKAQLSMATNYTHWRDDDGQE